MAKPLVFLDWPTEVLPIDFGPYRATVDRWLDGDTGLFIVDLGMGEYIPKEIRLADASAPEKYTTAGKASWAFIKELLPRDSRVILHTQGTAPGFAQSFSRWVAAVLMEDGSDLATVMVEEGYAVWGSFQG